VIHYKLRGTYSIGDWSLGDEWSMGISGNWGNSLNDWGSSDNSLGDLWGRSFDNSVESVDWVSGVGDSSDSTIGLNKGVLSLDNITVSGFVGGLGVSGQSVGNAVSVVVLWVSIVWLWSDGFDDSWGNSLDNWSVCVGDWSSVGNWSSGISGLHDWSSMGISQWSSVGVGGNWSGGVSDGSGRSGGNDGQKSESLKRIIHKFLLSIKVDRYTSQ